MAKYVIEDTTLNNIANAIREKTGKIDAITPANFATEIASIESGGNTSITKGVIINEYDSDGYPTDASFVGFEKIPNNIFRGIALNTETYFNKSLTNVQLPEDLTSIGNYAFAYCGNLALTSLPSGITSIGYYAFQSCVNLSLTELPSGLTKIEQYCFSNCHKMSLTELPSGITSIGEKAFESCTGLSLMKLPSGINSIGMRAFQECTNLSSMELPSGITSVSNYMFYNCTSLSEVTLQGVITSIGSGVFNGCTKFAKLVLTNITSVPTLSGIFTNTLIASGTGYIYVPDDLVESFKSASNWSTYADQIKPISELEVSS